MTKSIYDSLNDDQGRLDTERSDDKDGTYWQRIDNVTQAFTGRKDPFIKIHKTTVKVVADPKNEGQEVDDQTTEAMMRDRFNYLEKNLRRRFLLATTPDGEEISDHETRVSNMEVTEIAKAIIEEGVLNGLVFEVKCSRILKKNAEDLEKQGKDPTFVQRSWLRRVSAEELEALEIEAEAPLGEAA